MRKVLQHSFTYVILTAFLLLVVVEMVVRTVDFWGLDPKTYTGRVALETRTVLNNTSEPKLVFLGSSHFQFAIAPTVIAQGLGVHKENVANIYMEDGRPTDYLGFYKENRQQLMDAEVLIVNISARDFNWGRPSMLRTQFRRYASLEHRSQVPYWKDKLDMMVGWFWGTWDQRSVLREHVVRIMKGDVNLSDPGRRRLVFDDLGRLNAPDNWKRVSEEMQPARQPYDVMFHDFRLSYAQIDALAGLVEIAETDGVDVMLLETPLNPQTLEIIENSFGKEETLWREEVEKATGLTIRQIPFQDSRCAVFEDCLHDYGHMNSLGSRAYSESIQMWLMGDYPGDIVYSYF